MTDEAHEGLWSKLRWELIKWTGGAVFGLITGIVTLLYAPFGDDIQEKLDPTSVIVGGRVMRGQAPAPNVVVRLDEVTVDETGGQGRFWFEEVGKGRHQFVVEERGELALREEFVVPQGVLEYPVGDIDLAAVPLAPLGADVLSEEVHPPFAPSAMPTYVATEAQMDTETETATDTDTVLNPEPTPPPHASPAASPEDQLALMLDVAPISSAELEPGMAAGGRRIEARLEASSHFLTEIDRVTYYLDPAFNPSVVTRYSAEDGFLLSFVTPSPFPLAAKVYLKDGTVVELERAIIF